MRHLRLCILFISLTLPPSTAKSDRPVHKNGGAEPIPTTPNPPFDKATDVKLVNRHGRTVKLRLFLDNFQLVLTSTSQDMSGSTSEKKLHARWNRTGQDVVPGPRRLHKFVDRQLASWKALSPTWDQINTSRTLGEFDVKRLPYNSIKLEFKARRRLTAPHHEGDTRQGDSPSTEDVADTDALDDCSKETAELRAHNGVNSEGSIVAWFLVACIVAQILTMLSLLGVWSPRRSIAWLGDIYEAITNDVNQLGLRFFEPLASFICRFVRSALNEVLALSSRVQQRHRSNTVATSESLHSSRFPPFLKPGTSAEEMTYLHIPEGPQTSASSSTSSFSSYTSELPFLSSWGAKPDRSPYNPVNFDFVRCLGEGYFGKVVQLQHRENGQMVAVKIMAKRKTTSERSRPDSNGTLLNSVSQGRTCSSEWGGTVDLDTVQREVRVMTRVQNSPYAEWSPRVLSTFSNEESYFIVMPFYERGDIIECMKRGGGCVSRGLARFYIAELISAIHFLHTLRIVHRDIKPDNLLLGIDGHLVIADLGIAHVFRETPSFESLPEMFNGPVTSHFHFPSSDSAVWLDDDDFAKWEEGKKKGGDDFPFLNASTDNPHVITGEQGTPIYAAPEVFGGGKYSYGVDYYSMGIVYHHMLTGYLPLENGGPIDANNTNSDRRWILDLRRHDRHLQVLSAKERSFLEKVLQHDPFKRPGVSKMKADPLFSDIDWDKIGRREAIVPPALSIRRRGSLELATARCESVTFDLSSTCSVDSNVG